MATKDFLARGFNCIEYKDGSRHNIADYCDMAIRTANKRANLMGEGEMMKKLGIKTCYVSKHGGACDKCTPWEDVEQYAINQYIGSKSYKINEILRNELDLNEQQKEIISNLDRVLDKMPIYKGNTTRSLMLNENELENFIEQYIIGDTIKYKAYTSSTVGSRYNELSNVELHIKSKSGRDIRSLNKE